MDQNQKIKFHFERFEFKYPMSEIKAEKVLRCLLANNLEWDPYAENLADHSYTVTSLYYDSPILRCYREKVSGILLRFKLRERIYSDRLAENMPIFYEIKNKKDAVIIKDRAVNSPSDSFEYKRHKFGLTPNLLVQYKRQALQGKFQDRLRVTFDYGTSTSLTDSLLDFPDPKPVAPGLVIMEIKYNNTLPAWFSRIITANELGRQAFSKYCIGVEANPQLLLRAGIYNKINTRY